eukprot:PITA_02724
MLQGESSQDKSEKIPLEKLVSIPQEISVMKRGEDENERNTKQGHVFSLTKELEKIRIQVPLTELVKTPVYQREIAEFINLRENVNVNDTMNLQEDKPIVVFGPHVEEVDSSTPPFYIPLLIHDFLLHNCMFDSGASHNLMPLSVMKQLNLQVTKPYRDLYSFDSNKVKCLGVIKDMVVSLAQIPTRSLVMDVVVADIPARFGMLLSRSWGAKLGGVLKLDFTYAVIPIFCGEERRLYRETRFVKTITKNEASNSPVYSLEKDDFACFMLHDNAELAEDNQRQHTSASVNTELQTEGVWKCFFDGAYSKEGTGTSFLLIAPRGNMFPFSFKLEFETTNNVAKYESLIIALQTAKQMGVKSIFVFGDSELIIKQIKNHCQTKHPRLRIKEFFTMIEDFQGTEIDQDEDEATEGAEHKIPLKEGIKPLKQKLRQIKPLLLPLVKKEIKKLLNAKIIVPLKYSDWVANLVPVRKKNGEIRLCVDFRNLNRASLKYNYPLPKMDHVLQKVTRSFRLSMLDGFSGYKQVVVDKED